jgi:hypothetical protein
MKDGLLTVCFAFSKTEVTLMSSNRELRVRRQELNDYAEGRVQQITSISWQDGLANIECNDFVSPPDSR